MRQAKNEENILFLMGYISKYMGYIFLNIREYPNMVLYTISLSLDCTANDWGLTYWLVNYCTNIKLVIEHLFLFF